jgi:hypothetical protein
MHSNLPNEMTEPKTGVARSLIREKYNLKLGFCTVPISMNSDSTTHISSAVTDCHSFTLNCLEKILPLKFWTAQHSDGFSHNFLHNVFYQKLFKSIYSDSQALNTVLMSTNSTKSFSLSDLIVHFFSQQIIITHAVITHTVFITSVQAQCVILLTEISVTALSVSENSLSYSLKVSFLVKRKPFIQQLFTFLCYHRLVCKVYLLQVWSRIWPRKINLSVC